MKKITLLFFVMSILGFGVKAQGLTAAFGASEAMMPYYEQGWDSQDEFNTWTYSATSSSTWQLGNP